MSIWRSACKRVLTYNSFDAGRCGMATGKRLAAVARAYAPPTAAPLGMYRRCLQEAARFERWRRDSRLVGVRAVGKLLKITTAEAYGLSGRSHVKQVLMRVALIYEPKLERLVPMLAGLPAEESSYYEREEHLVVPGAVPHALFQEITEQYVFVVGEREEFSEYFRRPPPPQMWEFSTEDEVRATAGFACVPKNLSPMARCSCVNC